MQRIEGYVDSQCAVATPNRVLLKAEEEDSLHFACDYCADLCTL